MVNHDKFQHVVALLFAIKDNDFHWKVIAKQDTFVYNYIRVSLNDMDGIPGKTTSMDIHFYEKKTGSVQWEVSKNFPTSHIFPLKMRPFGMFWLPAPNNPAAVLNALYDKDYFKHCEPNALCSSLTTKYPFVERTCVGDGVCIEKLELNSITIGQIEYHD